VSPCLKTRRTFYTAYVLRSLIFETHVEVKWCNVVLSSVIWHGNSQQVVRCANTQCTVGVSCDGMILEYCDMLLIPGPCNSRAGTAAREYALRYPGRCYSDANALRRLAQRLHETTHTAHVNAGRPWTVRTPANEDATIAAVEREPWRSSSEIAKELGPAQQRDPKYFMTINCIHTITRGGAHLFPDDRALRMQFCECYVNTLWMSYFYVTF
jgi:hypothetical protein